ncbi:hypothetical protein ACWDUL_02745 [Nocardia niigatensis]
METMVWSDPFDYAWRIRARRRTRGHGRCRGPRARPTPTPPSARRARHLLVADPNVRALLGNPYDLELQREGDRWLIRRMRIDNTWYTGDPTAIFGA